MSDTKAFAILLAVAALMMGLFAAESDRSTEQYIRSQPSQPKVICHEDDWCWNNLTQGNHIGHYSPR